MSKMCYIDRRPEHAADTHDVHYNGHHSKIGVNVHMADLY